MTFQAKSLAAKNENPFRAMRLKLSLTQEMLAERSGVSLETVVAAESDLVSLPLHEFFPIANYLNIDPGEVFEYLRERMAVGNGKGQSS